MHEGAILGIDLAPLGLWLNWGGEGLSLKGLER